MNKTIVCLSIALLGCLYMESGFSADIIVDTTVDENDGSCLDGDCSLRDAIAVAASGDRILVPAGAYVLAGSALAPSVSLDIVGAGAQSTIIDGDLASGVFSIESPGSGDRLSVSLEGLTISNAQTGGFGGGVSFSDASGRMSDCIVRDSSAFNAGGVGISDGSDVLIERCAIIDNLADGNSGGGIIVSSSSARLIDSTVSGNRAPSDGRIAGGIAVVGDDRDETTGTLLVRNSTIVNNEADDGGSGIFLDEEFATLEISNSVVANNPGDDCNRPLTSLGWNLDSDDSCGFTASGDQPATDPDLNALALNGGQTLNFLPNPGSPLIDAGNPAAFNDDDAACTFADQRGFTVAPKDRCDIGSVESDGIETPLFQDRFESP